MTVPVGGLRARLIRDSLYHMVNDALIALGWFGTPRQYKPIDFRYAQYNHNEPIAINTLALADEVRHNAEMEMGSILSEHRWTMYLDFFGESDALSVHLINDCKDILEGRMPSIGRDNNTFIAYDYTQATPPSFAGCEIESCVIDRARDFRKPWEEHWYSLQFEVIDYYGTEAG